MSHLSKSAKNIRRNIITFVHSLGNNGAHVAPALSMVEIVAYLFLEQMKLKKEDLKIDLRDRFVLSKGHGALAYYCALYEAGLISKTELDLFEQNGGPLPGQPSKNLDFCIDYSSGSLGLGLSYAIGLALSKKCRHNNIYVLMGDGELNEGSVWESAMFGGFHNLKNITVIVDKNGMQSDGCCKNILTFDIKGMWMACGWDVIECNGHNFEAIKNAFEADTSKPKVILANTIKGKGISFMENSKDWHHNRITDEQFNLAIQEIESGDNNGN